MMRRDFLLKAAAIAGPACLRALPAFPLTLLPVNSAIAADAPRPTLTGAMKKFTLNGEAKPAPEIRFLDRDDNMIGLDAFKGQVILVNLWATWCAPCRAEMPSLDALQKKLGGKDFEVVAIAVDRAGREKVNGFLAEVKATNLKPYLDQSMKSARLLGAPGLPVSILFDRSGREVGRLIGEADWSTPEAEALIRWQMSLKN